VESFVWNILQPKENFKGPHQGFDEMSLVKESVSTFTANILFFIFG
jgi:hypothetical protein